MSEEINEVRTEQLIQKSFYDRQNGEIVNLQEQFIYINVVFDSKFFEASPVRRVLYHLREGEVLIDRYGKGSIQRRPSLFSEVSWERY